MQFDITILTEKQYVNPIERNQYIDNVLLEDELLKRALEEKGLKVHKTNWDNPNMNWNDTEFVIFRTTWDYFDRYEEFSKWLESISSKTHLINSDNLLKWNIDKHYLQEIEQKGINIPPTTFIEKGSSKSLEDFISECSWEEIILKPTVSGAARHTYKFNRETVDSISKIFNTLIQQEDFMIQEYQNQITTKGEVAFMVFGGEYSHAVLKKAKEGDFRVQDDFGGTLHDYNANKEEIAFVEKAIHSCPELPIYARIDVLWDNNNELAIGEIELIEPELWFRRNSNSATLLAEKIKAYTSSFTA